MLRLSLRLVLSFAVAASVMALSAGCTRHDNVAKTQPAVRVKTVAPAATEAGNRYSGSILAEARVDVAFRIGGYVDDIAMAKGPDGKSRLLQEGDRVTKGMILVRLRQNDVVQKLAEAKASRAEAVASREQAQLDHDRTKKLLASKTASPAEADQARLRLDVANARLAAAEAKVAEATTALDDATLKSPLDGLVLQRSVELGTLAAPGAPAFVVADTGYVKVVFGVPDVLLADLSLGSDQAVTTEAAPGQVFLGKITRIAPYADPKSRVFEVEVSIPNADGKLKIGMVAALSVAPAAAPAAAMLPLTAILRSPHDQHGFAVLVVEDKGGVTTAHMRDVQLGDFLGNMIPVTSGLAAQERVVVQGAAYVSDGETVRVLADAAQTGAGQ